MAIAKYTPKAEPLQKPDLPKIEPDIFKGNVYDDKVLPLHNLIAYIEGSTWTVDYYKQVLGGHNDLRDLDTTQQAVYQQYSKIVNLELRVSSSLSSSTNSDTQLTTVTGSATIYPFLTPNANDYFIADSGSSEKGLFRITNVERKTFNRDSVHNIEYTLVGYLPALNTQYEDLESKVTNTYYFNKDRIIEGLSPVLRDTEQTQVNSLKYHFSDIVKYYFKTFFTKSFYTFIIPGQSEAIYDHYVVNYMLKIVDTFEAEEVKYVKQLPMDDEVFLQQPQIYEVLLKRDKELLLECNKKMGLASKYIFSRNPFFHGLTFTNIEKVVYPSEADTTIGILNDSKLKPLSINTLVNTNRSDTSFTDIYTKANVEYKYIYPVLEDNYYVLSSEFYNNTNNKSVLEILVKDYLNYSTIDLDMLFKLINKYKSWNRLEQFYYGPILLTLIKEANVRSYS